jgi:hypothetical protein
MKVYSLCDRSMVALIPWRDAGFDCVAIDIAPPLTNPPPGIQHIKRDILSMDALNDADFVMGWPPCTHLAGSGARHWKSKGDSALEEGLATVEAVIRLAGNVPLVLENPIGRLSTLWRQPNIIVQPWWYDLDGTESYQKSTCLWLENGAHPPQRIINHCASVDMKFVLSGNTHSTVQRSTTPRGLANAIFKSNGTRLLRGESLNHGFIDRMTLEFT